MKRRCSCFVFLLVVATAAAAPYRLEEIALPAEMSPEISALTFAPSGRLVVANRHGEVWTCDPSKRDWRRFAYGLHEPMGILVVSDREMFVCHRPELTRLRSPAEGEPADRYETVSGGWGITDNWHEFVFGLRRDREGNFIVSIGLPDTAGPFNLVHPRTTANLLKMHEEEKPSAGLWQGWVFKITPTGGILPWASGFRMGAGVGLSPDEEIFVTDQQGDYIAASSLSHVQRGRFYGHPASLKWDPRFAARKPTMAELEALRTPPAVVLPHGSMGGSPGEPVWDMTGGKFGPFAGQVFVGDFTKLISRVDLEKVAGEYQGACFPFLRDTTGLDAILKNSGRNNLTIPAGRDGKKYFRDAPPLEGVRLRQGNMRLAFAPDGSLYVGQTTRGWASGDGLQRIVWTGETPVEIQTMRLTDRGFAVHFTAPMDAAKLADPRHYRVERFRYLYHPAHGSPRVDVARVDVTEATSRHGGRAVELTLDALEPGFIYRLEIDGLTARDGRPVQNPLAYYTLNRLRSGRTFTGPLGQPLRATAEAATGTGENRPDPENGRRVYLAYCVACHQADGRGGNTPGFAAADFVGPTSPLVKRDDDLLRSIANGIEGKAMPPFGSVLSPAERRDALAFVRAAFGRKGQN
jgi:cytochrome c5